MSVDTLFRSVDIGVFAAALTARLRSAGIQVGLTATERFVEGLSSCRPRDTTMLYWVAKTCLVHDRDDLATFDAVFADLFDDDSLPMNAARNTAARVEVRAPGTLLRSSVPDDRLEAIAGRAAGPVPEVVDADDADFGNEDALLPELLPSELAHLSDTPFDELRPSDVERIGRWLQESLVRFPMRRSRRRDPVHGPGQIDLRRTLADARGTGGEPVRLRRRRARKRPRGIVMLADVSGSMESFTRIYLHLMRSLVLHGQAEVFTFATSLRRVTVPLRDRDPQLAIDRMSAEVVDRYSGTRIGASLAELMSSPAWSNSVRGSVVVIASDGWDAGAAADLDRHMRRLQRMAHRVVWINPRAAAPEYEPLVAGMSVALPSVDTFLSGHSLSAIREVLQALESDPDR